MSSQEAGGRWVWLWNRLRCMTMREVVYRAQVVLRSKAEQRLGLGVLRPEKPTMVRDGVSWVRVPGSEHVDAEAYVQEALRVAQGSVRLFASQRFDVGAEPRWNRCPLTGVEASPRPAHAIAITDRAAVGDIKYLWELNRHLHWVVLAQAWALSGDRSHLMALSVQLRSWLKQCPYGQGPNWTSSLEFALRLLNWSVVWQLIGGYASPLFDEPDGSELREQWLLSVNLHVRAIAKNYSRHSSANNHLVGELAGVFVATQTWPLWPQFAELADAAREELEREVDLQVTPDGVLREQAFEYATFTFDFFLAVQRAAHAANRPMSAAFVARMQAMCEFISAVTSVRGEVPQVGDADGAEAFRLDPRPGRDCFASMQHKGAALFQRLEWLPLQSRRREDIAWLGLNLPEGGPVAESQPRPMDFPEGGYFLFGCDLGQESEWLGLVDAGPLGYLGIAAHGHSDALQVCLAVAGRPVLIDSGTYSYWADRRWRDYFRGTSAHNTVRVNRLDQSVSGGRFMWTRKARVDVASRSIIRQPGGGFELSASHEGYQRLKARVTHHRQVSFMPAERKLRVHDRVQGLQTSEVELFWHIAPEWQVERLEEGAFVLHSPDSTRLLLRVHASQPGRLDLLQGSEEEPLAWFSPAYGEKTGCSTIRWSGACTSVEIGTLLEPAERSRTASTH